jgi:radical SAM superfamily enzyme YgiQ (UPF0313 family)
MEPGKPANFPKVAGCECSSYYHRNSRDISSDLCFLAHARGAKTIAFGTHITPIPVETMRPYPGLDIALVGEPDLTIRDLLDHLEGRIEERSPEIKAMFDKHDPMYKPSFNEDGSVNMHGIKGIAWRKDGEIMLNFPRQFVADLDQMPIPMHELLPLQSYRMPLIKGPFTFIVTSRGCPAGCTYCIKHVSYQYATRLRSPKLIMEAAAISTDAVRIMPGTGPGMLHFYQINTRLAGGR